MLVGQYKAVQRPGSCQIALAAHRLKKNAVGRILGCGGTAPLRVRAGRTGTGCGSLGRASGAPACGCWSADAGGRTSGAKCTSPRSRRASRRSLWLVRGTVASSSLPVASPYRTHRAAGPPVRRVGSRATEQRPSGWAWRRSCCTIPGRRGSSPIARGRQAAPATASRES